MMKANKTRTAQSQYVRFETVKDGETTFVDRKDFHSMNSTLFARLQEGQRRAGNGVELVGYSLQTERMEIEVTGGEIRGSYSDHIQRVMTGEERA